MSEDGRLGRHFWLSEFGAEDAPPEVQAALRDLVLHVLDPLRDAVGGPVLVTADGRGGWRPDNHGSQHQTGHAGDVKAAGMTSRHLARLLLEAGIEFDQLIWYDDSAHLHVSWRARPAPRNQVLRASTVKGKRVYRRERP